MKKFLGVLLALAGVAAGAYVVYDKVLTPEARQSVDSLVNQGITEGKQVVERVQGMVGAPSKPTGPTPEELAQENRAWVAEQWKKIGF